MYYILYTNVVKNRDKSTMQALVFYVEHNGTVIQKGKKSITDDQYITTEKSYLVSDGSTVRLTDTILEEADLLTRLVIGLPSSMTNTVIEVSTHLLSKLHKLEHLVLNSCSIVDGPIVDCLPNIEGLKILSIVECAGDTTGLMNAVEYMKSLTDLEIGHLEFKSTIDLNLADHCHLQSVEFYAVPFSSEPVLPSTTDVLYYPSEQED